MNHVNTIKNELVVLESTLKTYATNYAILPGLYGAVRTLRNSWTSGAELVDPILSLLGSTIIQFNKAIIAVKDLENELKKIKKKSDFDEASAGNKRKLNANALKLHAFIKEALGLIDASENRLMPNFGVPQVLAGFKTELQTPLRAMENTAEKIKKVLCYMERQLPGVFTKNYSCIEFF
ncbi:hypothetical protein DdX_18599 [Ditylenchus destructor]|uniref:Uncharacterized protein n=1 Tax=Ditylenchus destructor TaxID=166010 RepID=A0AAD4MPR6_9BILA|nr:hypothetical protein DdX_18599 [Ditylenchus destructor]